MDRTTEEIRARADIVDVIGGHIALRPAGNNRFKACCPFHDEKTPSFYVSRDRGFYKCFGCGKAGDVFNFLIETENLSFPEAKRALAERYGVKLPQYRSTSHQQTGSDEQTESAPSEREQLARVMAAAAAFFRAEFQSEAGSAARQYAHSRGLSRATIEKFGIGYSLDGWDFLQNHLTNRYGFSMEECAASGVSVKREGEGRTRYYDRFRHRLMFPIWDNSGRVIAFGARALEGGQTGNPDAKYINSPEGTLFKKNQVLYAYHLARAEVGRRESVIVTEGYMDAIALHEAGFSNTVATLGTALTTNHIAMLRRLSPKIVYLCFDGDSAGIRAALRTAPLFTSNNLDVRVVELPSGEDPDTFIKNRGEIGFENALRSAKLLMQYRIERAISGLDLSDLAERKEAIHAAGEVIAEVFSPTEKDSYISWLAEQWARAEGISSADRLAMVEAAVRREVLAAEKQWKRKEAHVAERQTNETMQVGQENEDVSQTLAEAAGEVAPGIIKAERALLSVLLSSPTWRPHILKTLPAQYWTQPPHREIAALMQSELHKTTEGEDSWTNPATILEKLPEEAGGLIAELLLGDEAAEPASDSVINDWIARVQSHWARREEKEILELVIQKLDNGETITPEERELYNAVLYKTKRRVQPEPARLP